MTFTVRQYKANVGTGAVAALDDAPLRGSRLFAHIYFPNASVDAPSFTLGTDWEGGLSASGDTPTSATEVYPFVAYKNCGEGESHTQRPLTNLNGVGGVVTIIWEIALDFPVGSDGAQSGTFGGQHVFFGKPLDGGAEQSGPFTYAEKRDSVLDFNEANAGANTGFPRTISVFSNVWAVADTPELTENYAFNPPATASVHTSIIDVGNERAVTYGHWYSLANSYPANTVVIATFDTPLEDSTVHWATASSTLVDGPYEGADDDGDDEVHPGGVDSGAGQISYLTSSKIKYVVISHD